MWDGECILNFRYADEEMRAVYGTDQSHQCTDCKNRTGREAVKATGGDYCTLTNKRRKCSSFGFACGRYKESGRYKFVVK